MKNRSIKHLSLLLFSALYFGITVSEATPRTPFRTKVAGMRFSEREFERYIFTIRTVDGLHRIQLQERPSKTTPSYAVNANGRRVLDSHSTPRLFKGEIIPRKGRVNRGYNTKVSGDIIGDKVRLIFYGQRRGRLYTVTTNLKLYPNSKLSFHNRYEKFNCGGVSHGIVSSVTSGSNGFLPQIASAYSPARTLALIVHANSRFFETYGSEATAQMLAIINTADSLYSSQLGINLDVVSSFVNSDAGSDPFTATDSVDLLEGFQAYGNAQGYPALADDSQLFAGQNFDGDVIGLAYSSVDIGGQTGGPVCRADGEFSYSIIQDFDASINAITSAHELGHTLAASHTSGVMDAIVQSTNTTFSNASIAEITDHIDTFGSCLAESGPGVGFNRLKYKKPSGKFTAVLLPSGEIPAGDCTLELFCGGSSSALLDLDSANVRLISSSTSTNGASHTITATVRPRSSSTRRAYFATRITCGEQTSTSAIRSVQVLQKAKGFCRSLSSKLQ